MVMNHSTAQNYPIPEIWINKHIAAKILGLSIHTLKKLRSEKARPEDRLLEGIHFVRYGKYCVRYNAELLRDYAATRSDPKTHRRAIETYLASLPSNQPKRVGRARQIS
ncbi:hypothetical protein [Chroococcidiopsis sp. CCNUC1]|uniref:hypothetical protein n=1 Tax=Chroococcidiopsis sp. CCNUC1 TaxID=2653189 RepID=UPI00202265CA|nr:hypothetical protein [Chroococcidiopsis sp. CCNUC1]URD48370.1 hypothetical protein M5J74_18740 [Chroococcidiopsis sp. CCNUC1]